jgi:hypothetical protein
MPVYDYYVWHRIRRRGDIEVFRLNELQKNWQVCLNGYHKV